MSQIENENLKQDKGWLLKCLSLACTFGLMVSSYFLTDTVNKLNTLDKRMNLIELKTAESSGKVFTSADWTIQKTFIDNDRIVSEKRFTKLEEAIPSIKESLQRIEIAIEKTNNRIK